MNKPAVSVIIPAYNHDRYISDTINSIINQTYKNIELIIIDDGSRDLTWQKISEMKNECSKRFIKISFSTRENKGTCATLNELIEKANGKYIYFIASDDIAKPDAIELMVSFLENNKDYSLAVGDNEIIDSSGKICYWDKYQNIVYDKKAAAYKTFSEYLQKSRKVNFSQKFGEYEDLYFSNHVPNGYLVRKNIFDKIGLYTNKAPLEDWWLMCQISKYAKMKFINKILFSYRWHDSNTIKNIECIDNMIKMNIIYENSILKNIDTEKMLPKMKKIISQGIRYKTIGVPKVLNISKFKNHEYKFVYLQIFVILIPLYKKQYV